MRLLVIHPRDPAAPTIGGIQTFLHDLIKYSPPDFEITVAGTSADRAARPIGRKTQVQIAGRGATVLPLAGTSGLPRDPLGLLAAVWAQVRLRAEMVRGGRILQVHRPYRGVYLVGHRGPRVQFVHVDIRDWPGPSAWGTAHRVYRQFSSRELARMAHVFVVNEPGAEILRREHPDIAERIEFLPVWYDEDTFHPPTAAEQATLRRELGQRLGLEPDAIEHERLVVLAVRLTEIKKPVLAVETLAELLGGAEPRARLIVAGAGDLLDQMKARAAELGVSERVHFLGDVQREEVARLMQSSDALLLTARSEGGGPRVVVEALACGLPVVSTEVVEVRRTVTSGVNGWLVADATPANLAAGLVWAFGQPRAAMVERAVDSVRLFTARAILERLYATYRGLAAR